MIDEEKKPHPTLEAIAKELREAIDSGGLPALVVARPDRSVDVYVNYGGHLKKRPDVGVLSKMAAHLAASFSEIVYRDIKRTHPRGLDGIPREVADKFFIEAVVQAFHDAVKQLPGREITIVKDPR